jgi:hypothetical protein
MTRIFLKAPYACQWLQAVPLLILLFHCALLGQAQSRSEISYVDFTVRKFQMVRTELQRSEINDNHIMQSIVFKLAPKMSLLRSFCDRFDL